MKKCFAISILLIVFARNQSLSQNRQENIVIGSNISIQSFTLDESRDVQIFLPKGYESSNRSYPVLYLLDGQNWFTYTVSIHNLLSRYGYLPEFIIVGIKTEDSPRFGFFANSNKLLDFLEKDLITYIDTQYRTSKERLLFGWQFAGSFTIEAMDKRPYLFEAYFAASPIPINDQKLMAVSNLFKSNPRLSKTLFFATSLNENGVEPGARRLEKLLVSQAPDSFSWAYKIMKNETVGSFGHRTTPMGTLYHGLREYFHDYPTLEFNTLEDFNRLGGYNYVQRYYKNRASKYGLSEDIPQEGMFFLVRLGLDSNHYPTFNRFMLDFMDTEFLNNVNLGWGSRYAEFYLKHNDADGAQLIYEKLIERFPDNARPVNGLGDVYKLKKQIAMAKEQYEKAVSIAERTKDSRIQHYKEDLNSLIKNKRPTHLHP